MPLKIRNVQVWSGETSDRPGAAAATLERLAHAGADLDFVFTRSLVEKGTSKIYLAPITSPEQINAARDCGLSPDFQVSILCVEGANRPGIAFQIMSKIAVAGIHLSGLAISVVGDNFTAHLAFDNADAATMAVQILATIDV
jgi:hypothetical protein